MLNNVGDKALLTVHSTLWRSEGIMMPSNLKCTKNHISNWKACSSLVILKVTQGCQ